MQLTAGRYRFAPARSRARVVAHAPGHDFRAEGAGIEGTVELEPGRLVRASASFPLAQLRAGDPLGDHELLKFLGVDAKTRASGGGPTVRAEIAEPIELAARGAVVAGQGWATFTLGAHATRVRVDLEGTPVEARAKLALTFSGLGREPPKLLFLRVKDTLEIEISSSLELDTGR